MLRITYPSNKLVDASKLFGWAKDAYLNKETATDPHTMGEAITILEDLGHVSFDKSVDDFLNSPLAYRIVD